MSYLALLLINRHVPLRTSLKNEKLGMHISEHRASTELLELLTSMKAQEDQGRFEKPEPE